MGRWTAERWIPVLATLLALQVGAAVALAVRADRLGVTLPLSPLIDADLKSIDKLVLDGAMGGDESAGPAKPPAARVELVRKDGHWTLPDSYGAPAADAKVQGLLDKLANARRGQPIGTSEAALRHFKVANDEYERHVVASASGKVVADLWLGSSTALRKTGVRVAPDRAVYAVDLATWDIPAATGDWLDAALLKVDAASLAKIEALDAKGSIVLTRAGGADASASKDAQSGPGATNAAPAAAAAAKWQASGEPAGKSLDPARANALAETLGRVRIDGILGTRAQPDWNQDQPQLRLVLTPTKGDAVTWTISKPKAGSYHVVKASDKPWFLLLKDDSARPLMEAAGREKLFATAPKTNALASRKPAGPAPKPR